MLEIKYQNILEQTLQLIDLVIIDFYAEWCNPCKILSKQLEKLEIAHPEYTIVKINVEEENLAKFIEDNQITSLPTLKIYYPLTD